MSAVCLRQFLIIPPTNKKCCQRIGIEKKEKTGETKEVRKGRREPNDQKRVHEAEQHTTDIPHKYFCMRDIERQKPYTGSSQTERKSGRDSTQIVRPGKPGQGAKSNGPHNPCNAIDTVHKIEKV